MSLSFPCPRCSKPSTWEDNVSRPFCSERCKLIDLGAWASDKYTLPTQDAPQSEQSTDSD